jgi:hypothetical protein
MAAEDAPDTVQEVASSIQDTILAIWADFVDRIPFLIAGLVVLLLTWLAAMLLSKVFDRLLHSISIYWYMPAEQLSPRLAGDNKILVNDISIKGSSKPTDTKNREQQILLKISGHQQR